jgi:ubiquinone/menaquinone biosynthesis C-methylase UbiE
MIEKHETEKLKTRTTYNAASDHFDDDALSFWDRYGRRTVERLHLSPGAQVLDVGCGTGASALPAAEYIVPDGFVIGVDLADKLLAIARAKAVERQQYNVEFRIGDMENLGFPDSHFDAVISVFSIFFVTDMEKQVRELWRMVRPGGQLAITTWGPEFTEPMYGRWQESLRNIRPDLASDTRPLDRMCTTRAVGQLLLNSGISHTEVILEPGNQPLRTPEDWWSIVLGTNLRWTVDLLGEELAAQVREDNVSWAAEHEIQSVQTNVIYATARKT